MVVIEMTSNFTVVKEVRAANLFLILQLIRQPIKTFIKAIATSGTCCLDIPIALAKWMQSQFVCDLGSIHCIRQILCSSNDMVNPQTLYGNVYLQLHGVSEKTWPLIFCFMLVKYELISIKIGAHVLKETLNKTTQEEPYSLTIHYLRKFEATDWVVNAVLTWKFYWITEQPQTWLSVIVSKIVKRAVSYIISTLHDRNVRLQRVLRSHTLTNWDDTSKMSK